MPKLTRKYTTKSGRRIPATMVSQHPDHASAPYWQESAYIRNQEEIFEAYSSFFELGVSEYKWDWEGKFVDEAVVERLLSEYFTDFKREQLGRDKFLTFRLPNPKVETEFRLGRAFMGILGSAGLAEAAKLHTPPLFEVILPMTESAEEMIEIQDAYQEIAGLKHPLLKITSSRNLPHLELIPLFEQVDVIIGADAILKTYISYFKKLTGKTPEYMRPYVARSDPALNEGLVPTVLAIKIALSRFARLAKETGIEMYPIIGSASLPFRGGLTPYSIKAFMKRYAGVRTALLQSAFRYDYPLEDVQDAINMLESELQTYDAVDIPDAEVTELLAVIAIFSKVYREVIEGMADVINAIAQVLPKRRERVQHTGLFGYSRGVGKVRLPRAIGFTAGLYSVGAPPEFIGTGRAWGKLTKRQKELVLQYFDGFEEELQRAARFVSKEAVYALDSMDKSWGIYLKDIAVLEKELDIEFEPKTKEEKKHALLVKEIVDEVRHHSVSQRVVEEAAYLRKSLG